MAMALWPPAFLSPHMQAGTASRVFRPCSIACGSHALYSWGIWPDRPINMAHAKRIIPKLCMDDEEGRERRRGEW